MSPLTGQIRRILIEQSTHPIRNFPLAPLCETNFLAEIETAIRIYRISRHLVAIRHGLCELGQTVRLELAVLDR